MYISDRNLVWTNFSSKSVMDELLYYYFTVITQRFVLFKKFLRCEMIEFFGLKFSRVE